MRTEIGGFGMETRGVGAIQCQVLTGSGADQMLSFVRSLSLVRWPVSALVSTG